MLDSAPPSAGEVRALANQLMSWANLLSARPPLGPNPSEEERLELALALAVAAREADVMRERLMPGIELGNPAWRVLLELFIRQENGFRVEPGQMPTLADLPRDAVEAAIGRLVGAGLAEHRSEGERRWLATSERGRRAMIDLLLRSSEYLRPLPALPVERTARAANGARS